MKTTVKSLRDQAQGEYAQRLALEFSQIQRELRPITTEQPESTKRLLAMTKEEVEAHKTRPNPTNWLAVPDAKSMDEAVAARKVTPQEVALHEDIRRKSKNTQGDAISEGMSAFSKERRESARQAFTCTPPAKLTEAQIARLAQVNLITEYVGEPPVIPKKKSWLKRLFAPLENEGLSLSEKIDKRSKLGMGK